MPLMDFESINPIASFAVPNNEPRAEGTSKKISAFITSESWFNRLIIGLEYTRAYANYEVPFPAHLALTMLFFDIHDSCLKCHGSSFCVAKLKYFLRILDTSEIKNSGVMRFTYDIASEYQRVF